jgi:hypothetical protein
MIVLTLQCLGSYYFGVGGENLLLSKKKKKNVFGKVELER